jgi:hypothetical protein
VTRTGATHKYSAGAGAGAGAGPPLSLSLSLQAKLLLLTPPQVHNNNCYYPSLSPLLGCQPDPSPSLLLDSAPSPVISSSCSPVPSLSLEPPRSPPPHPTLELPTPAAFQCCRGVRSDLSVLDRDLRPAAHRSCSLPPPPGCPPPPDPGPGHRAIRAPRRIALGASCLLLFAGDPDP